MQQSMIGYVARENKMKINENDLFCFCNGRHKSHFLNQGVKKRFLGKNEVHEYRYRYQML